MWAYFLHLFSSLKAPFPSPGDAICPSPTLLWANASRSLSRTQLHSQFVRAYYSPGQQTWSVSSILVAWVSRYNLRAHLLFQIICTTCWAAVGLPAESPCIARLRTVSHSSNNCQINGKIRCGANANKTDCRLTARDVVAQSQICRMPVRIRPHRIARRIQTCKHLS